MWKQRRRNEQSSEVWKSSSKDTDVYMSTRGAQYVHGRKTEKFHSAQEASKLKTERLKQCWGKYHC